MNNVRTGKMTLDDLDGDIFETQSKLIKLLLKKNKEQKKKNQLRAKRTRKKERNSLARRMKEVEMEQKEHISKNLEFYVPKSKITGLFKNIQEFLKKKENKQYNEKENLIKLLEANDFKVTEFQTRHDKELYIDHRVEYTINGEDVEIGRFTTMIPKKVFDEIRNEHEKTSTLKVIKE
jgi:hypothetical protein